jgi:cation:H+ antiporter
MVAAELASRAVVFVVSVVALWVGARSLVDAAVRLARRVGLSDLTIGLTVVALGTSAPELVVTTDAALGGLGDIAVGNVVGSNVFNLAVVLGTVSLVRAVPVERSLLHRDGAALVGSTLVGGAVLADATVGRAEGLALVGLLVAYTVYLLRTGTEATDGGQSDVRSPEDRADSRRRDVLVLVGGLVVVLVAGHYLVTSASALARAVGVSEWVVGGTIVAAGTSTPEFAVSFVAVRRGTLGVSVGNVVGSNVFNVLGIMGVAAVVSPMTVAAAALSAVAWLAVVTVVVVAALWSGRRLSRAEGGALVASEAVRWTLGLVGLG